MAAKLDRNKVEKIDIGTFNRTKLAPSLRPEGKFIIAWNKVDIPNDSGIYALRLDKEYPGWEKLKTVDLHGPKTIGKITYQPEGYSECKGWVYVGTTSTGIKTRFQRQVRPSNKNGHMIFKAMGDFFKEANPVDAVFRYGTLYWTALPGIESTANRFFVESKLIAALFPIFNVKSEH